MEADRYPTVAGDKGTDTGKAAAQSIQPVRAGLHQAVRGCLRAHGPQTADEIASRLNESILAIRPRLSELRRLGKVYDVGSRRRNRSGRRAIVWGLKWPA